jgi:hypothetical protein
MRISVELNLNDEETALLKEILGCTEDEQLEADLASLGGAALEEYCRMVTGQKVFARLQDLRAYRLRLLIKAGLFGVIPGEDRVSAFFQTTQSESRTLIRTVISKYQHELKNDMKNTLREILKNGIREDQDTWAVEIPSAAALEELRKLLARGRSTAVPIEKKKDTVAQYTIKASARNELCALLGMEG